MTKEDKQIIDRAVKGNWRIGDRTRLKHLLGKNLKLYRENVLLGERCKQLLKDKGNLTDELQELKETLAQTIENDEVNYETLKLHDQEEIGMLNSKVTELENKIADIKANCDLAIEGRDIKIKELELELTVEKDLHQEEINLHLHAEDYIKSLEKENKTLEGCLLAEQEHTQMLEEQIEKMKCCANCKSFKGYGETCEGWGEPVLNLNCDCTEWELRR